ncbi:MAG: ThiF family adenylyltransferase [Gammaproteobacteria bacterium]|nr:ThiF family adenylyltransferase [Gammaproteobacteria bacterium]
MNPDSICRSLLDAGYDVALSSNGTRLTVTLHVAGQALLLEHDFCDELLRVPRFKLLDGHGFGRLAHVLSIGSGDGGEVCIGDVESMSVSRDFPELVYRQTVEVHEQLLKKLIQDSAYNRKERLREFAAHWKVLCSEGKGDWELFVAWDGTATKELQVKPSREDGQTSSRSKPLLLAAGSATDARFARVRKWLEWDRRPTEGMGIGLRLAQVEPPPATVEAVPEWYFKATANLDLVARKALQRLHKKKSAAYWVVFSAKIPGSETQFAVRWWSRAKGPLPKSKEEAQKGHWKAMPFRARSLSRSSLVPRGGGSLDLGDRSVLLVGCGSVGSEVAYSLTSAGVGRLTVSDPDEMSEDNVYRHTLAMNHIGMLKSTAVAEELALKHPWAAVVHWDRRLETLRNAETLRSFDLVIIAIGSPTVERAFAEFCLEAESHVPTVNCWLEGYGVGGHATLVVPGSAGCWHCAYVNSCTLEPGLASNLNFLEENQIVMRNHGGCGTQFLPFSGIAARQTAAMAADLAVAFLSGEVRESSRVSWKGRVAESTCLQTTYRYRNFNDSLRVLPLRNENCGYCSG